MTGIWTLGPERSQAAERAYNARQMERFAAAVAEADRAQKVAEAMARIEPLPGEGPNRWTVDVVGWGLSAPTKRKLSLMLWHWFAPDDDEPRPA